MNEPQSERPDVPEGRAQAGAEARFAALLGAVPCAVAEVDGAGRITACNPAFADLHGATVAALVGRPLAALQAGGPPWQPDAREREGARATHLRADGTAFPVRLTWRPYAVGGLVVVAPEAEPPAGEAERSALAHELQTLLDVIPVGVGITHDADCREVVLNPALRDLLRLPPGADLAGRVGPGLELEMLRDGRPLAVEELPLRRAARTGEAVRDWVADLRRADGSTVRLLCHTAALPNGSGGRRGAAGVFVDVTERGRAIEALRVSEERFRLVFEHAPLAIALVGRDGVILRANAAAGRMLGCPEAQLAGCSVQEVTHPDDWAREDEELAKLVAGEQPCYRMEKRYLRRDGAVVLGCLTAALVRVGPPEDWMAVGLVEDVTEQRRLEARAEQGRRLESLAALAGGVAHDFSNALTAIVGYASLAEEEADGPVREHLRQVLAVAERAGGLCRQMLAASGRGRFVLERCDLSALARAAAAEFAATLGPSAELRLDLAGELPEVEVDAGQVRQALLNLLRNAAEALGERGGVVTLTTGREWCDRERLRRSYLDDDLSEGEYLFAEVADTGPGMDATVQRRLFEPFFSTKFPGRGLGLPAVLGIVRGHRGAVQVDSAPGKGARFRLLLPRAAPAAPAAEAAAADGGGRAVLFADDEPALRRLAELTLRRAGFEVLLAGDGVEAVEAFRRHHERLALVVLDLTMPRLGGAEALRLLRAIDARVPVLLSSGYSAEEVAQHGGGAEGFLQKPYRPQELAERVQELVGRGLR